MRTKKWKIRATVDLPQVDVLDSFSLLLQQKTKEHRIEKLEDEAIQRQKEEELQKEQRKKEIEADRQRILEEQQN